MLNTLAPVRRAFILLSVTAFLVACEDPSERSLRHYDRGLSLLESGAPEKAALEFRNALRLDEGFVAARFELAKLLEQAGDLNGALANLRAVIEHDPAHAQARVRLANAMLLSNNLDTAMEHAEVAVRAGPLLPSALVARSMAAYRLGDVDFALADANAALDLDPANPDAGLILAIERRESAGIEDALEVLDRFIPANPASLTLHLTKLQYLLDSDDHQRAGAQLARMVVLFPTNVELRRRQVDWHLRNEAPEAAEAELAAIQDLLPGDVDVLRARISLRARQEGNPAARALLTNEIAEADAPDPFRLQLAVFDYQAGEQAAGKTQLRTLITETADPEVEAQAQITLSRFLGMEQRYQDVVRVTSDLLETDPGNAEALALRAAAYLQENALEDALFDVRAALAEDSANVDYLMLSARAHELNGTPVFAGESLASAVVASEYAPEPVYAYASFLSRTGESDAIGTLLSEASRRHPDDVGIAKVFAQYHLRTRNWMEAEALAARMQASEPETAERIRAEAAVGQRDPDSAVVILDQLANGATGDTALLAAQIRAHVRAGDKESARALIAARSAETPDDPGLLHLRGAMHELDGELDQAARLYRRMIQVAPDLGAGYVRLAALQDRQEDQDAALATLTSGLDSVSDDAMLRLHVASIALRRGDAATAIAEFEQIYSDQPGSMLAANNLASALAEYREHDPQQIARAEKIARRLAGSTNPAFQDTFGWTRFLTGDTKGALSPLMRAAKELPKNPWVQYHVGMAHFEAGDLPTAKTHLEAALRIVGDRTFAPRSKITQAIETIGN